MRVVVFSPSLCGLQGSFSPKLVHAGHLIPGMAWDGARRAWCGSPDAVEATVHLLQKHGLTIDTSKSPRPWEPGRKSDGTGYDKRLRGYQEIGVDFLVNNRRAILADDMGIGKTLQTITAARAVDADRMLVVCPNSVKNVWWNPVDGGELEKWAPDWSHPYLPEGKKAKPIPDVPVVVIHFELLHHWEKELLKWAPQVGVVDEAHSTAGESSKRAQSLARIFAKCDWRWLLTGTPLPNRPKDLWGLFQVLDPGRFGPEFKKFGLRYCGGELKEIPEIDRTVYDFNGKSNVPELQKRLRWVSLRRTTEEVGLELPPFTRQLHWLEGKKSAVQLAENARALQAALWRAADKKLPEVCRLVVDLVANGKKVAFYGHRVAIVEAVVDAVRKEGLPGEIIHGSIPVLRRKAAMVRGSQWKEGGVIGATLDVGAQGIDLTFCDMLVNGELSYKAYELRQAEKRVHRFGAKDRKHFLYVLQRGSIDEIIADRVVTKLDLAQEVFGGAESQTLAGDLAERNEDAIVAAIMKGVT